MKFIVDENTGPSVARWLANKGYDIFSVYDSSPGLSDEAILAKAFAENFIIITCDKDFGELVYKQQLPHRGVILLRLNDETPPAKIKKLEFLLAEHQEHLIDKFVVVSDAGIRVI